MIRFSPRIIAILVATTGLSAFSLTAQAEDRAPFVNEAPPAAAPAVAAIAPADLAGVLNYCIETNFVTHGNGDAVQTALNAKTHAVPPDQHGNVDYATGTTGQFIVGNALSTITKLSAPDQGKICSLVVARAQSLI